MKTLRRCSALFLVVVSLGSSDQDCSKEVNFQEEVERLERQLENYRHVVEQQESLIEVSGHRPQHQAPENKPTNAAAYSPKPHAEFWNIKIGLLQYPAPPPPKKKIWLFFLVTSRLSCWSPGIGFYSYASDCVVRFSGCLSRLSIELKSRQLPWKK